MWRCRFIRPVMADVEDSQSQWAEERGAIKQEVARDLSSPTYKFITRLNRDLFAGTPYATDPLGTDVAFDKTTGDTLKSFFKTWYAPNNAILVVAGDVDAAADAGERSRSCSALFRGTQCRDILKFISSN